MVNAVGHVPATTVVGHAATDQSPALGISVIAQRNDEEKKSERFQCLINNSARQGDCQPDGEHTHVADAEIAAQRLNIEDDKGGERQDEFLLFMAMPTECIEQGKCAEGIEIGDKVVERPYGEEHLEEYMNPVGGVDAEHIAQVVCTVGDLGGIPQRPYTVQKRVQMSCGDHVSQHSDTPPDDAAQHVGQL